MELTDSDRVIVKQIDADGTTTVLGVRILLEGDAAWIAARPGTILRDGTQPAKDKRGEETSRGRKHFYWRRAKRFRAN